MTSCISSISRGRKLKTEGSDPSAADRRKMQVQDLSNFRDPP
jgi:hypothetical protein